MIWHMTSSVFSASRHCFMNTCFTGNILSKNYSRLVGDKNEINHWKHRVGRKKLSQSYSFWNHLQIPHDTYSGLLWFYILFLHWYSNSAWQWYPLAYRLAYDNVFYKIFFNSAFLRLHNFLLIMNRQPKSKQQTCHCQLNWRWWQVTIISVISAVNRSSSLEIL